MSRENAGQTDGALRAPVPGTVRVVTTAPIMLSAEAAGDGSLRDALEDRPWLLAVGFLGLLGFFLAARARPTR